MFDEVAKRYDVTNNVLTFGQVNLWRIATREAIGPRVGMDILDLAAGTGSSSAVYARFGANVVSCDFSEGMMREGRRRYPHLNFVRGDAMDLPFEDNSFDVTTISYGLRNVADPHKALREMYRVTRPGGKIVVAEFSRPTFPLFRDAYLMYMGKFMPFVSNLVSSDSPAYSYLMESIIEWPPQRKFAGWLHDAGWRKVEYRNVTNGVVAIHRAMKPE